MLATAFAGCLRSEARAIPGDTEAEPAATFKAGHGIRLSAEAAEFVGLATAEVEAREESGSMAALGVPAAAVLRTARGAFVFVKNGAWFVRAPVAAGPDRGGWCAVGEGLYEGDIVVTSGVEELWVAEIQAVNGGVSCTDGH